MDKCATNVSVLTDGVSSGVWFEPLESRQLMSAVQIFAAGSFGSEQLQLSVKGAVVKTFNNLGNGADRGEFVTLNHQTAQTVTASDIRLSFINDFYDEARDIDWNVTVDAIAIDGERYETESPDVFSTGTFRPQDEIVNGYGRGDTLHTNGYFQYADPAVGTDGSTIRVFAAGEIGTERIGLQIDGATVKTWDGLGTTIDTGVFTTRTFETNAPVTANQVRVAFLNDTYDEARGIDSNVQIDAIEVDGVRYESESLKTFSTATYRVQDEFVDGYGRGDTLHANGYFQYSTDAVVRPGRIQFVNRDYRVNEADGGVTFQLERLGGVDGAVSANAVTVEESASAGSDFTGFSGPVTFANGQSTATLFIPIANDTLVEGNESFSVSLNAAGGGAGLGAPRTRRVNITDDDTVAVGNGLLGEYFRRRTLNDVLMRRTDATVNFNWNTGSPSPLVPTDNFAVRWSGQIEPPSTGTYTFRTSTDQGVRLRVNGQLIIDEWTEHPRTSHTGQITLQAGQRVDLVMEYFEATGVAAAQLFWSSPTQTEQIVPTNVLFSPEPEPVIPAPRLRGETLLENINDPTSFDFAPDGTAYILTQQGEVWQYRNGNTGATPFVDLSDKVNNVADRGGLAIALHPNFAQNHYVYVAYTYDPPETAGRTGNAGPDGEGNRPARLSRFTADRATGFASVVAGSEVVILGKNSTWANTSHPELDSTNNFDIAPSGFDAQGNSIRDYIATDSHSHTIAALEFGLDGSLYVSIGDGTSYGAADRRASRVQDIDNLSGKLLRINPLTGEGYANNPFYDGDAGSNRSKVYASGLRNPFRISVNPANGQVYIGDVGWAYWEEINKVDVGGGNNFGWPYYEGAENGVNLPTGAYEDLPEALAFYASNPNVTVPIYTRSHADGAQALALGDFYTGTRYPGLENTLFFSDFVEGKLQAAFLAPDGTLDRVEQVSDNIGFLSTVKVGPDGYLYYTDRFGLKFGRIVPA